MITINLTNPPFSITYDEKAFLDRFPGSLISNTVDLTGENVVDLSHPDVTPTHLQILQDILNNEVLPQLNPNLQKGFNYLGIDIPEIMFTPEYTQFFVYPNINLLDLRQLDRRYSQLMLYALEFGRDDYPFIRYLFHHTDPDRHSEQDFQAFTSFKLVYIWSENVHRILLALLRDRNVISFIKERLPRPNDIGLADIVGLGYPDVLRLYVEGLSIPSEVVGGDLGKLIEAITYDPEHFPQYIQAIVDFIRHYPVNPEMYNLFRAMYTGDISLISKESKIDDTRVTEGLLYTAILANHPEAFNALLSTGSRARSRGIARKFFLAYVKHPKVINADMLRIILPYIGRRDRNIGADILMIKDSSEAARELAAVIIVHE